MEENLPHPSQNKLTNSLIWLLVGFIWILTIFLYIGGVILAVFVIGHMLGSNNLHLNWNTVLGFAIELKWPVLVLFLAFLFRRHIPGWAQKMAGSISKIVIELFGNKFSVELKQKKDAQKKPPAEPKEPQKDVESSSTEAVAEPKKSKTEQQEPEENLAGFWKEMFEFERIYRLIFGSQLKALIRIDEQNGASLANLLIYLNEHMQKTGNSGFTEIMSFLSYLQKSELMEWNQYEQKFNITNRGRRFLTFVISQQYPSEKDG